MIITDRNKPSHKFGITHHHHRNTQLSSWCSMRKFWPSDMVVALFLHTCFSALRGWYCALGSNRREAEGSPTPLHESGGGGNVLGHWRTSILPSGPRSMTGP